MSDRSSDTLWPKRESGFEFHLPRDGAAIDGDAWLAPLARAPLTPQSHQSPSRGASGRTRAWCAAGQRSARMRCTSAGW